MILATIEPESHFVQVGREMLGADLVPCTHNAAFQKRERIFNGIGVNVAVNVDLALVANGFVFGAVDLGGDHRFWISRHFVCDHYINVSTNVFLNILCQRSGLNIARVKESEFPATLPYTNYDFLVAVGSVPPSTATALLSTDVGFVHFDCTVQHGGFRFFHGCTDAMAEIPRSFVTHSKGALHLISGEPLASFNEQQDSSEPSIQREMRIVKDRSGSNRELVVTLLALEQLSLRSKFSSFAVATWTFRAVGPAQAAQNLAALAVGIENVLDV